MRSDYQKVKERAIARYYAKKDEILTKQKEYIKQRYKTDPNFRRIYDIRRISANKFKLTGERCINCSTTVDLQRHHIVYGVKRKDFIVLCRKCHNDEHKKYKEANKS